LTRQQDLTDADLWLKNERRLLRVLRISLQMLRDEASSLPTEETAISRKLYLLIRRANLTLPRAHRVQWPIVCNVPNQPREEDPTPTSYERKIPDFKCIMVDHAANLPDDFYKFLDIECKRLGNPTSKTHVLNKKYVTQGVVRFVRQDWAYGRAVPSGIMIGYVQSMTFDQIRKEVNDQIKAESLTIIRLGSKGWVVGGVSELSHRLTRIEVPPSPFTLRHLWIDLRFSNPKA
jgi:hypothetical protein